MIKGSFVTSKKWFKKGFLPLRISRHYHNPLEFSIFPFVCMDKGDSTNIFFGKTFEVLGSVKVRSRSALQFTVLDWTTYFFQFVQTPSEGNQSHRIETNINIDCFWSVSVFGFVLTHLSTITSLTIVSCSQIWVHHKGFTTLQFILVKNCLFRQKESVWQMTEHNFLLFLQHLEMGLYKMVDTLIIYQHGKYMKYGAASLSN